MSRYISFVFVICAVLLVAGSATAEQPGKKIALVIGNATYKEAPLRNPVNDARAMAAALHGRGFEIIHRENASKQQMETAIVDFGEKLNEGSTGLFFYAGHGMQVNGRNYLVPVDATIASEQRVRIEATDVDLVLEQMNAANSRMNMVILDACRNNPFERRFRAAGGGLAQINAPQGTLIAYSTAPGRVAADGEGRNSLYTEELVRAMGEPGMKVEEVFKAVRIAVANRSGGTQTPWEASSLVGDFYFAPPLPAATGPNASLDVMFWDSVKDSGDPDDFQIYLKHFPSGQFAMAARQRVAALRGAAPGVPASSGPGSMQQAALPPAGAPVSFDGHYTSTFFAMGQHGSTDFTAGLTIQGTRIRGFAQTRLHFESICPIQGNITPAGVIERMDLHCKYSSFSFSGRFMNDPAAGALIGDTKAISIGGRTPFDVRWTRDAATPVTR